MLSLSSLRTRCIGMLCAWKLHCYCPILYTLSVGTGFWVIASICPGRYPHAARKRSTETHTLSRSTFHHWKADTTRSV
jgi:hypothetical protein